VRLAAQPRRTAAAALENCFDGTAPSEREEAPQTGLSACAIVGRDARWPIVRGGWQATAQQCRQRPRATTATWSDATQVRVLQRVRCGTLPNACWPSRCP